ncbi:sodium/hydrogen exchanger 5-like [Sebastes umbrosus]|uniref:sodium/hydrogen exchanger 5-like n=1 Tax=Sebastes umbrosus TaxID=72105 RepID=UPI00189F2754|nr:sodium/hydrogen exchanger 5-like [Sebastes umbrosus]
MPLGEKERQDREVFQRNMKSRMETFKSTRHKRHKKERSLKKRRGSDAKEDGSDKPRRNVSWQDKNPVVVPVDSEEDKGDHSDPEKEEDVGITFVARKVETPKQRPKSVPAALDGCPSPQSPSADPPSPPSGDSHLPWKGGVGSPPPCVSVEATKIIPVDLQQAWNQSISSLESISSPPAANEAVHPRVSVLSRLGGPRPVSYTPPGSAASSAAGSTSSIGAQVTLGSFCFPEKKKKEEEEEDEEEEGGALQEMQPLMSSVRPPGSLLPPPLPPGSAPGSGRRRNPCVYLRSLVTAPPPGGGEPYSRGPTQL